MTLDESVQLMDFGNGETVYVTGGHVDLRTAIVRAGGVGSKWSYIPGQVFHGWLKPEGDGYLWCGDENPGDDGVPVTAILEPDGLPAQFKRPRAN